MKASYSGDTEAAWTIKAKKPYNGYKAHIAMDAEHGCILAGPGQGKIFGSGQSRSAATPGCQKITTTTPGKTGFNTLINNKKRKKALNSLRKIVQRPHSAQTGHYYFAPTVGKIILDNGCLYLYIEYRILYIEF